MQAVEHFEARELFDALQRIVPRGRQISIRHIGPSDRPWRGVIIRDVHGVRICPMKTRPAVDCGRRFDRDFALPDLVFANHPASVDRDHHVRSLDDGVGLLAFFELEIVDSLVGDRGGDDGAADIDADMRGRRALVISTILPLRMLRALIFMAVSSCWSSISAASVSCQCSSPRSRNAIYLDVASGLASAGRLSASVFPCYVPTDISIKQAPACEAGRDHSILNDQGVSSC